MGEAPQEVVEGDASAEREVDLRQVTLNTSVICNFRCTYCAVGTFNTLADGGHRGREQDLLDVPGKLDELFAEGYRIVVFSGGEPTVERDLPRWLSHARGLGFVQRTVNTNAARLGDKPALAARLVEAGLTHVNISFHTCRPATFDAISGTPGAFDRVVRGLDALLAQRPALEVHCTLLLMGQTADHVGDTVRFLAARGVRLITVELVRTKGAADVNSEAIRCEVGAVARALGEARRAADERGVVVNAVDIPSCLLERHATGPPFDLDSYLIRRRKARHWVVNKSGSWPINRLTHVRGAGCARCAFSPWCNGFERSLVELEGDRAAALAGGAPLPEPVSAREVLVGAERRLSPGASGPDAAPTLPGRQALSLLAPPDPEALAPWLRLYERYGEALLAHAPGSRRAEVALLGLFPAPRPKDGPRYDPARHLRLLLKREALLQRHLGELRAALAELPAPTPPPCCASHDQRAASSALFWLSATLRHEPSAELNGSLLPELAPFVTCRPGCEAARALARARLAALHPARRALAERLRALSVLSLGPWARALLRGSGPPERFRFDPGVVLLTDPTLPPRARQRIRLAFAGSLFPLLERGGMLSVSEHALVVSGATAAEPTRYARTLAWVPTFIGASSTSSTDSERRDHLARAAASGES